MTPKEMRQIMDEAVATMRRTIEVLTRENARLAAENMQLRTDRTALLRQLAAKRPERPDAAAE
jgi:regulator of replication initiation timing